MKISQSLLFAYAAAQGDDRWGSTDYYSFNYGFGGKQDSGIAFGMVDTAVVTDLAAPHGLEGTYGYNSASAHYADNLHFNGLLCWMCDFRLDLATEAESTTCTSGASGSCQNAYARCLRGGMLMRCRGEQRTCMFEERRRHGVVYSVCTGCKQTDACVAHWRRNQRFTLPFMNFGDMSLRNLPQHSGNLPIGANTTGTIPGVDQLPNHRPIYVDDECSTYQETRSEAAWRKTVNDPTALTSASVGTNNEVYPMGWIPAQVQTDTATAVDPLTGLAQSAGDGTLDFNPQNSRASSIGRPFSTTGSDLKFTGHRVNLGLSYSKFAYDGANDLQLNAQLSQWESTCRWCCHARPDTVCNIEMKEINSSPFATKCGNPVGTRRSEQVIVTGTNAGTYAASNIALILAELKTRITTDAQALVNNQAGYWQLLTNTDTASITMDINGASTATGTNKMTDALYADVRNQCSLSNAQWATSTVDSEKQANRRTYPQGIHGKFRFFQPFNIAQSNADYYNAEQKVCGTGSDAGKYCTLDSECAGSCSDTGAYETGPRFWMQMFQRTPQYDLSAYYKTSAVFTAKFPSVGEGRNSAGMDKFAGRGNLSRSTIDKATLNGNTELQHFFQHQTDMVSQENRDFFDGRARDAQTSIASANMYLRRYDNNDFWTSK